MKLSPLHALVAAALFAASGPSGSAQIERLDLRQMVAKTDGAVVGTIRAKEVVRVDHPVDGPELYFTFLTVEGTSLVTGEPQTVEVAYYGGFVDAHRGVFNSEAPSEDDTRVGNRIVAFYKWMDDMGGDVAANVLYASHGGLYRTYRHQNRWIVQGRGEGYAIDVNVEQPNLEGRIREQRRQEGR